VTNGGVGRRHVGTVTLIVAAVAALSHACTPGGRTETETGAGTETGTPSEPDRARIERRPELADVFRRARTTGTFALFDVSADRIVVVDSARAVRRFVPASTFKLTNSLIALEVGAVADIDEVVPYGGEPQPFASWERDMPLREAFPASNVPVYQNIARRIGLERMAEWLTRLDYGNQTLGDVPDRFWLEGPLEISAVEQVRFIARLARGELPARPSNQAAVRDLARVETTPSYTLFGKTGWRFDASPQLGWWVGWVEREGNVYAFALNIDIERDEQVGQRVPLGRELLQRLGVLEPPGNGG
jgi:beta-lactamase class D